MSLWILPLVSLVTDVTNAYISKASMIRFSAGTTNIHNRHISKMSSSDDLRDYSSPTLQQLFGEKGVIYIDEESINPPIQENNGFIFASSTTTTPNPIMEIPLMPFSMPLFPGAKEMLHIYEMKYRNLMNDAEALNNTLGRCYVSPQGNIGAVGSLCRIVERKKMGDGTGFYVIESYQRFRIRRIIRRSPYLHAEIELEYDDFNPSNSDIDLCEYLCQDIYVLLKMYLRLARLQSVNEEGRGMIEISPGIRDSRPGQVGLIEIDYGVQRHQAFTHACSHLLSTEPAIMQQLLQSRSIVYRLHGIKRVLEEAISELSSLLLDDDMLLEEEFQAIQEAALSGDDDDLMPTDDYNGIHIDDDLSNALSYELGLNTLDEEFSLEDLENHFLLNNTDFNVEADDDENILDTMESDTQESSPSDDDWDNIEAFQ
jgi:hypothetical protein